MNDTEIRRKLAMYDSEIGDCYCGCEDAIDFADRRYGLKVKQLRMWIETYGTAE